jgi:8-oxo-dGTP diphosphatase
VSRRLTRIGYQVAEGHKQVDYWVMRDRGGAFRPTEEIDDARWLSVSAARARLSYEIERGVLDEFARLPVPESVIVLVRHAKAGKRAEWHADDNDRPLDDEGRAQAERLSQFLQHFGPDRIITAAPLRCVQTVQPLARDSGLELIVDATFSDDAYLRNPDETIAAVHALAKPGRVSVVCSQGETIPGVIEHFAPGVRSSRTKKAAAWVLGFVDGTVASADYYPHAAAAQVTAA